MKFTIVLFVCCLLAAVYAEDKDATVVKQISEVNPEDYKYELELSNQIHAIQEGQLQENHNWVVKGSYEYVSKEGKHIKVTYTADDKGYHPKVEQQ